MSDEAELIDPSGIPHFIGDLATLDTDVMLLTADAGQFRASGANVHTTFQQLSAFYSAPEAEQLFGTTLPVRTKSDAFADDLEKVAGALSDYSLEVQPLVKKLDALKAEATAFVHSIAGDDDWRKDQDKVDHNNDLWHDVNHTVAAFQAAELRAYNRIMALIGGTALTTDDGSHGKNMYGYAAADLDQAEATPWGAPAEREYEGWSWLAHQGKQVWDGVWHDGVMGTVHGLGTLAGWDGADAAGEAWKNLAKLGTGVGMTLGTLGTWGWVPDEDLPSWLRDSRTVLNQTAKGFVAWDQWKTNPGRAAGAFGFNALTVLGTGGAGAAASGTGKAAATVRVVSAVGKTSRVIDPMTYVGKAGKFAFTKVGDTFTALRNLHTPDLLRQAEAARSAEVPANAIPYLDHTTGKIVYLTDEGHLLNADGSVRQYVSQAKVEGPAAPRTVQASGADSRTPELVGAHLGNDGGAIAGHAGDNAASRLPEGGMGRASHEPSAGHEGPTAGGSHVEDRGLGHDARPGGHNGHPAGPDHMDASGHDNPIPSSGRQGGGDVPGGPPDIDPGRYTKNDHDLTQTPTGRMEPEQETGVLDELTHAKMPEPERQKVLHALRKSPYGAGVAEMLTRGHLRDIEGYRKLLDMCKQGPTKSDKGMIPAAYMAMRLATELQEHGIGRVGVELDTQTFDLDVYTLHADGSVDYGYQLKDVDTVNGIKKAVEKSAKQLAYDGVGHRVAVLDVHQSMADLTPRAFRQAEFQAERMGGAVVLRFTDGSITVPPNAPTLP
ncbi:hypothetical protein [Streptomyces rubradiris]|uniref:hypothetical protein n=1 Tax=Streptomyces rubradiris TaxID=285531 RepID=UPI001679AF7C|nr:hypothetical protein [Streptomyces rubradiris]